MAAQIVDGGKDIIDVEGKMVAADIAVARQVARLIGRSILEDLEVRAILAAQDSRYP